MTEPRFRFIFARELHERLVWFGGLRWAAAAGLASFSLVGTRIGIPSAWPSLFFVGSFVAIYNAYFVWRLRALKHRRYPDLRAVAIREILMDLTALTVTVHFTGGLVSPLLPFFTFHMAIGTIMIATRVMFLIASIVSAGLTVLYVLEVQGLLRVHAIDPGENVTLVGGFHLAAMIVTMFGIVFLTHTVASRFKKRNIELFQTTEILSERSNELQSSLQERKDLERRKSHYMRISAHQLRSPLATVKTSLQVLNDGIVEASSERGQKLLRGISERVDSLLFIVNDLLELAKIREGREKAPWSRDLNVNQLLADLFDSVGPLAEDRGIELVPEFDDVAVLDWAIPPDLVYAFENLFHNAIKYSHRGGKVTVSLRVTGERTEVRVTDRGIGVPEEYRDQIFLEFVRTPGAKRHVSEGTGLGLAIVKEVVEAHGGRVTLESSGDDGSVFLVSLPLRYLPPEKEEKSVS